MNNILEVKSKISLADFVMDKYLEPISVLKILPSYEDTNVLVQSTKQTESCQETNFFVSKILCDSNAVDDESLCKKIECVKCLKSNQFLCSDFYLGRDGNYIQTFTESGPFQNRSALLYSFIEGKELEYTGYFTYPSVISELGSFIALFHRVLRNVPDKEALVPDLDDPWHLQNYKLLFKDDYLGVVKDYSKRKILLATLDYVDKTFGCSEDLLTKDILHGDFHGLNVIVNESFKPDNDRLHHSPFTASLMNEHGTELNQNSDCDNLDTALTFLNSLSANIHQNGLGIQQPADNNDFDLLKTYGVIDFEAVSYSYTVLEIGRLIADVMVVFILECCHQKVDEDSVNDNSFSNKDRLDQEIIADGAHAVMNESCCHQKINEDSVNVNSFSNKDRPDQEIMADGAHAVMNESSKDKQDLEMAGAHYAVMNESCRSDLIRKGGYVLAGYLLVNELSLVDLKCIFPAVLISLCQYYILGTKAALDPSLSVNYVSYCSREALMVLEFLHHIHPDTIVYEWVKVAGGILQHVINKK